VQVIEDQMPKSLHKATFAQAENRPFVKEID